jgi:hypothetical protein
VTKKTKIQWFLGQNSQLLPAERAVRKGQNYYRKTAFYYCILPLRFTTLFYKCSIKLYFIACILHFVLTEIITTFYYFALKLIFTAAFFQMHLLYFNGNNFCKHFFFELNMRL